MLIYELSRPFREVDKKTEGKDQTYRPSSKLSQPGGVTNGGKRGAEETLCQDLSIFEGNREDSATARGTNQF